MSIAPSAARHADLAPSPKAASLGPKPPRRPKRPPRNKTTLAPLTRTQLLARGALAMVAAVMLGFLVNLVGLSQLQHLISQQQLRGQFTEELASGTAPVSEGDYNGVLLPDGVPVGRIEIPAIGVSEIIVEGTGSGTLTAGPGHRRDTVLPGQAGVSVILARANAYGGSFGHIQELPPGETISVITGQGESIFKVRGVRYAGDPAPAPIASDQSRLVLVTARGAPYAPSGVVRVDAELVSKVQAPGARQTNYYTLPTAQRELGSDLSTLWALVFALQFLLLAVALALYSWRLVGGAKAWVVCAPVLLLAGILVADQITRLLPNLI